jgi:hypothetical protein
MGDHGLLHPQIDVEKDQAMKEHIKAGQYQPHPLPLEPLQPWETISVVWPGPPPYNQLQVFITLPIELSPPIAQTAGELPSLCAGSGCLTNADRQPHWLHRMEWSKLWQIKLSLR